MIQVKFSIHCLLAGHERIGGHPVGTLRELHPHVLCFGARNPLVNLSSTRQEFPKHGSLGGQAGELGYIFWEANTSVRSTHAKTILPAQEAFSGRRHKVQHLLCVDSGVKLVRQAVDAVREGNLQPISVAERQRN